MEVLSMMFRHIKCMLCPECLLIRATQLFSASGRVCKQTCQTVSEETHPKPWLIEEKMS